MSLLAIAIVKVIWAELQSMGRISDKANARQRQMWNLWRAGINRRSDD